MRFINKKSRVKGDFHARFRENVGVQFPCVTRLAATQTKSSNYKNYETKFIEKIFHQFAFDFEHDKHFWTDNIIRKFTSKLTNPS
jgi:hypothetical protein